MISTRAITLSLASFFALLGAAVAHAQDAPAPAEGGGEPLSALMFLTFGVVLVLAIGAFAFFLRKRSNRDAANRVLNPNHPSNQ